MGETDFRHPGQDVELPKRGKEAVVAGAVNGGRSYLLDDPYVAVPDCGLGLEDVDA